MDDCCWTRLPYVIPLKKTIHLRVITSSTLSAHVRTYVVTLLLSGSFPLSLAAVWGSLAAGSGPVSEPGDLSAFNNLSQTLRRVM